MFAKQTEKQRLLVVHVLLLTSPEAGVRCRYCGVTTTSTHSRTKSTCNVCVCVCVSACARAAMTLNQHDVTQRTYVRHTAPEGHTSTAMLMTRPARTAYLMTT